jgi:hypothetical protein
VSVSISALKREIVHDLIHKPIEHRQENEISFFLFLVVLSIIPKKGFQGKKKNACTIFAFLGLLFLSPPFSSPCSLFFFFFLSAMSADPNDIARAFTTFYYQMFDSDRKNLASLYVCEVSLDKLLNRESHSSFNNPVSYHFRGNNQCLLLKASNLLV